MSFLASQVQCSICTYVWASVYPVEASEDGLECPSCGAQDSRILERWGPDEQRIIVEVTKANT